MQPTPRLRNAPGPVGDVPATAAHRPDVGGIILVALLGAVTAAGAILFYFQV